MRWPWLASLRSSACFLRTQRAGAAQDSFQLTRYSERTDSDIFARFGGVLHGVQSPPGPRQRVALRDCRRCQRFLLRRDWCRVLLVPRFQGVPGKREVKLSSPSTLAHEPALICTCRVTRYFWSRASHPVSPENGARLKPSNRSAEAKGGFVFPLSTLAKRTLPSELLPVFFFCKSLWAVLLSSCREREAAACRMMCLRSTEGAQTQQIKPREKAGLPV